jgi:beta-fructofuranosidase
VLRLPDAWLWDFWLADTGTEYHLFFLRASRALLDPDRRHLRASVGHAVSTDLRTWAVVADALTAGPEPAWDDLATWTGSVVAGPDGVWRMFYTGISRAEGGAVQRVGVATSRDLVTWTRPPAPVCVSDPRWYGVLSDGAYRNEFWRDPWVFADPDGNGWHMLVTARAREGALDDRGVLGHAWSADLVTWQVREPRSRAGSGFDQLEVAQTAIVDGRPVLIFSCLGANLSARHRAEAGTGGVWALGCADLRGPFDVRSSVVLLDERFYSARLVQDRAGQWQALAFHNREPDGTFDGRLSDPMAVHWVRPGALAVG